MPEQTKLPVLFIETVCRDADALDFVTEPVEPLVAEQIAPSAPAPFYEDCIITMQSGEGKQLLDPCSAQVKVRGNWSTKYPKKSLAI